MNIAKAVVLTDSSMVLEQAQSSINASASTLDASSTPSSVYPVSVRTAGSVVLTLSMIPRVSLNASSTEKSTILARGGNLGKREGIFTFFVGIRI